MSATFLLLATLCLSACEEQADLEVDAASQSYSLGDPAQNEGASPCEQYISGMINSGAAGLLEMSRNPAIRSIIHQAVAQEFDGDFNVLFRDVAPLVPGFSQNLLQSANRFRDQIEGSSERRANEHFPVYSNPLQFDSMTTGFSACDFTHWMQIAVHNFDSVDLNQVPVIVIAYDELEDGVIPAFFLAEDGSIQVLLLDEADANQRLVWIVSLNETVDEFGQLNELLAHTVNESVLYSRSEAKIVKLDSIKIGAKHEIWYKGKADIALIFQQYTGQSTGPCANATDWHIDNQVFKLKKKDRNKWHHTGSRGWMADGAGPFVNIIGPLVAGESLTWALYESDGPKTKFARTISSCPSGPAGTYYSSAPDYINSSMNKELWGFQNFANGTGINWRSAQQDPWHFARIYSRCY